MQICDEVPERKVIGSRRQRTEANVLCFDIRMRVSVLVRVVQCVGQLQGNLES